MKYLKKKKEFNNNYVREINKNVICYVKVNRAGDPIGNGDSL
jgi:hypothetical protein